MVANNSTRPFYLKCGAAIKNNSGVTDDRLQTEMSQEAQAAKSTVLHAGSLASAALRVLSGSLDLPTKTQGSWQGVSLLFSAHFPPSVLHRNHQVPLLMKIWYPKAAGYLLEKVKIFRLLKMYK